MKDLNTLKYSYTLPEVLKIKEGIEMSSAMETAALKDQEYAEKMSRIK